MAVVQRIHLVCVRAGERGSLPRRGLWYAAPGCAEDGATMMADLAEPEAGEPAEAAGSRLETAVRSLAHNHRPDPLVLLVGPKALRLVAARLTGTTPESFTAAAVEPGAITVVGLPTSPRVIGPGPIAVASLLLAILDNILWGTLGNPFVGSLPIGIAGLLLAVPGRTRPWGIAVLKTVAVSVLITVVLLSSTNRFPAR